MLEEYRHRFRYLLVDEYQDTNVAQYLWLRLLAGNKGNICCVGDDDQSIFSWRGAEVGNILRFEKDFPDPAVVRLERNYRSTPHILAAASAVIANNTDRLGKSLWTDIDDGEKVEIRSVWDGEEEARTVCDEIENLQRKKIPLSEMAVLVRAGFQTREFEERLITLGIPYRVIGGPRFYERMEVRDAIAYLRLVAQPDDDLAYERIINKPKRGLGPATMREVHMLARAKGIPLFEATRLIVETEELKPKARKTLSDLVENFLRWRSLLNGMPSGELAATVLEESGYTEMWQFDKSPEAPGRLENLKEFVSALDEFESIEGFLEHISLVMENDESGDIEKVSVHWTKAVSPGWRKNAVSPMSALPAPNVCQKYFMRQTGGFIISGKAPCRRALSRNCRKNMWSGCPTWASRTGRPATGAGTRRQHVAPLPEKPLRLRPGKSPNGQSARQLLMLASVCFIRNSGMAR